MKILWMICLSAVALSGCGRSSTSVPLGSLPVAPTPPPFTSSGLTVEEAAIQPIVMNTIASFTSPWAAARSADAALSDLALTETEWQSLYQNLFNEGLYLLPPASVPDLSGVAIYATLMNGAFDFSLVTLTLTVGTKQLTYVVQQLPDTTYAVIEVDELDGSNITTLF